MKTLGQLSVVMALATVAAACGSDAEALTKSDYIEQADAICEQADDLVAPMFEEFFSDLEDQGVDPAADVPTDDVFVQYADVWKELVSIWGDSLEDLRALAKPEDDEKLLERLFDDFEAALDDSIAVANAAVDGSGADRRAMEDYDPLHDVNARARVYGLTVCGSEG